MKLPLLAALAVAALPPAGHAQAPGGNDLEIITDAGGQPECLAAAIDGSVALQPCQRTVDQRWQATPDGNGWQRLRNVALERQRPGQCLFTDAQRVRMADCNGSGYSSHRQWQTQAANGTAKLANKYIADLRGTAASHLQRSSQGGLQFGSGTTLWHLAPPPDFVELASSTDSGVLRCLTSTGIAGEVHLQACNGSDAQQWAAWSVPGPWQAWKSRALLAEGGAACLVDSGSGARLADCGEAGDARRWQWRTESRPGHDLLYNRHAGEMAGAPRGYLAHSHGGLGWSSADADNARWQVAARYGALHITTGSTTRCLSLAADNLSLEAAPCLDHARQEWDITPWDAAGGNVSLRVRALAGSATPMCLGHALQMVPCTGSGYSTMRTWRYSSIPDTGGAQPLLLSNKYLADLGRDQVLGLQEGQPAMLARENSERTRWQYAWPLQPHLIRPVRGEQRVLLLHAQWSDRPATDFAQVRRAVFGDGTAAGSLAGAVQRSSNGRAWLSGDAYTGFDLGPRPANCNGYAALRSRLTAMARERGIDRAAYDYLFIEVPAVSCAWSAMASRPGRDIFAQGSGHGHWMWQHEFGHNLGGPHATALQQCPLRDGRVQLGNACTVTTASDPSDTLNGGGRRLFALPYVVFAGWRSDAEAPRVGAGSYRLAPLYAPATGSTLHGLRVLRSDGSYLTLEYRQPQADAYEDWPAGDAFVNGVIARVARFDGSTVRSQTVDAAPATATLADAPLRAGQSMDDLLSGLRVTVGSVDAQGATVHLEVLP